MLDLAGLLQIHLQNMTFSRTEKLQTRGQFVKQNNLYMIFFVGPAGGRGRARRGEAELVSQLFPSSLFVTDLLCWTVVYLTYLVYRNSWTTVQLKSMSGYLGWYALSSAGKTDF